MLRTTNIREKHEKVDKGKWKDTKRRLVSAIDLQRFNYKTATITG